VSTFAKVVHQCGENFGDTVDCAVKDDGFGIRLFL